MFRTRTVSLGGLRVSCLDNIEAVLAFAEGEAHGLCLEAREMLMCRHSGTSEAAEASTSRHWDECGRSAAPVP